MERMKKISALLLCALILAASTLTFPRGVAGSTKPRAARDLPLPQLLDLGNRSIEQFWRQASASHGLPYIRSPRLVSAEAGTATPCGVVREAVYCPNNNTIYYVYSFMRELYDSIGDFAPVTVLAHEWGHSVQSQLVPGVDELPSYVVEQQADCFAGTYAKAAEDWGILDPGDMDEAGESLVQAADMKGKKPVNLAYYGHGTPFKRVSVFLYGYNTDVRQCLCDCIDNSLREYYSGN